MAFSEVIELIQSLPLRTFCQGTVLQNQCKFVARATKAIPMGELVLY